MTRWPLRHVAGLRHAQQRPTPDKGQRTELDAEIVTLDRQFYKLELKSSWFFKGLAKRHVLELDGRAGVADSLESGDVPFYDRYYLGGLYSLRGFKYRNISPRQPGYNEPIGGDTYWFGTAEYSIPIFEQEHGVGVRFAVFYDIGSVGASPCNFSPGEFSDNWGLGLRLNLPIGPLRLDYGIPIRTTNSAAHRPVPIRRRMDPAVLI